MKKTSSIASVKAARVANKAWTENNPRSLVLKMTGVRNVQTVQNKTVVVDENIVGFSVRRFNLLPVLLLGGQNANASLTNLFTSLTKTARIFTRSVETMMRSRFDESRHFF